MILPYEEVASLNATEPKIDVTWLSVYSLQHVGRKPIASHGGLPRK